MKTLTIRGLPDEVHGRLKRQAKENRRSLNQEVIAELGKKEVSRGQRLTSIFEAADRVRAGLKRPLTTKEIRAAIEEGRD